VSINDDDDDDDDDVVKMMSVAITPRCAMILMMMTMA